MNIPIEKSKKILRILCLAWAGFAFLFAANSPLAYANIVHVIELNDVTINPVTADYIIHSIDEATKENAACLIIELDTPGGLLNSTRSIVKSILSAKIPVVVYIYPGGSRAGSAGVFITYASHVAAMAHSTNIGAAHPVQMGGKKSEERNLWDALRDAIDAQRKKAEKEETKKDNQEKQNKTTGKEEKAKAEEPNSKPSDHDEDPMSSKILNDTVAFIKTMAKERGRNIEWAEMSVTESRSITEQEALEKGVIEIIADDEANLLEQLDGRVVKLSDREVTLQTKNASVKHIAMDFRRKFLNILADPNIAYIFFILGFYGLLFEVTHPGAALPGVLGTIFLILAFFSMQLLPTNYAGLALIILAIILFIAEAKAPGFGLFTLGGVACMIIGSMMLFDSTVPMMRVSMAIVLSFTLATAAITIFLVRLVILSHRRKAVSGKEGLADEKGYAYSDISPQKEGKVFVRGEIWNATAEEAIKKDDKITVVKVDGMTLLVRKI